MVLFTESAHWADSVCKLRCPSVCVCVLCVPLFYVLLLKFAKVKSHIDKLKKFKKIPSEKL